MKLSKEAIEKIAVNLIQEESVALGKVAEELPADFARAVMKVASCSGRVIVSGIGKSGHIGRKIAATLASTGTPAQFIHATEASHGDLGMVGKSDVCLLISNSGETAELHNIIVHSRRNKILLIAITSKADSTLGRAADLLLLLPEVGEAGKFAMAPTTSTTMTLALGDALAVSLMELRDFQPESFKNLHPGGSLGQKMLTVADVMRGVDELSIVAEKTPMSEVLLSMTKTGYGVSIVVNEWSKVIGVITDGDIRRNFGSLFEVDAQRVMSSDPATIKSETIVEAAVAMMEDRKVYSLIVQKNNKPIGLLRMHDCLRLKII